jgi:hypothetical protein
MWMRNWGFSVWNVSGKGNRIKCQCEYRPKNIRYSTFELGYVRPKNFIDRVKKHWLPKNVRNYCWEDSRELREMQYSTIYRTQGSLTTLTHLMQPIQKVDEPYKSFYMSVERLHSQFSNERKPSNISPLLQTSRIYSQILPVVQAYCISLSIIWD